MVLVKNIILKWLPLGSWAYLNNQKADSYSKSCYLQWQKCSTFQLLLPAFGEVDWVILTDSVTVLVEKAKPGFQKLRFLLLRVVVAVLAVHYHWVRATLCLPIYSTRYHKPVLILKLCAITHTNCANTLMHGNRCSFLWAIFLCDVCCDETTIQPFLVWNTCGSPEGQQRKGSKMASAWPASSLMAKHGQFLLVGDFFQLCLALKEFVTSNPSFAKVCKLCYVHQTLSVCARTSCCP